MGPTGSFRGQPEAQTERGEGGGANPRMKSEKQWQRLVNLINFLGWRGEQSGHSNREILRKALATFTDE